MAINVFVPKFRTQEILEEIKICLDKGWTGLGFKTVEFEEKWKQYTKLKNAHFLGSNTFGLHLALNIFKHEYGWHDGDEIITTPLTFISTNHVILYENLKPVFADVDEYLCLDPQSVSERISPRTRAIIFVGIGGNAGQYEKIVEICRRNKLLLILDAAHMSGTKLNGKHIGQESDVTVFSFQAVKNLPTADSGMICFKDDLLDKKARKQSWLGISKDTYQRFNKDENSYKWRYDVETLGFKYHGNSIIASMGLVQLKYLEDDNNRRIEIASVYDECLKNVSKLEIIRIAPNCISSRHLYQVCVEKRDEIVQYFYENDICPGVHYIDNIAYKMYSYAEGTCPKARQKSNTLITLPIHLCLSNDDIHKVVDVLNKGIKKYLN
jgi:dTDP-4-amino-4,6-dideoxygalactose transaminase